jgi:CMP-N-acetylneuraminic acid synthetase|tara:strand:- start:43 stop:765 length:723 start_codon:yes stop_codon:yes gene_type:complete
MKVLSIVCARAGSKGLNNKCITKINDKAVVEYAIEYSLSLGKDVETVVSTDIKELIEYCKRNNINYIERNPDFCTSESVIDHTVANAIEEKCNAYRYCSIVYGNIPTRYQELFQNALDFLEKNSDFDAVISMQNVEKFNPAWMFDFNDEILPKEEQGHYRRQMLPQKMIHDGHTLIFKTNDFYKRYNGELPYDKKYGYSIYGSKIKPLINNEVIIDVDTRKDLIIAEAVLQKKPEGCLGP